MIGCILMLITIILSPILIICAFISLVLIACILIAIVSMIAGSIRKLIDMVNKSG